MIVLRVNSIGGQEFWASVLLNLLSVWLDYRRRKGFDWRWVDFVPSVLEIVKRRDDRVTICLSPLLDENMSSRGQKLRFVSLSYR